MSTQIGKPAIMKLKGMVGQTFMYKSKNILITDYHVLGEEGKTQIDIEDGNGVALEPIKTSDLTKFIDACLPVDNESEDSVSTEVVEGTNSLLTNLQATLLDNINQVKKNPNYIKQANVVNSSVNSLIGLAKIQIQVSKMKKDR
jgi:hypothetical protein